MILRRVFDKPIDAQLQEWRETFNFGLANYDILVSIGTLAAMSRLVLWQWPGGASFEAKLYYWLTAVFLTMVLFFLQARHKNLYIKYRIPLLICVRMVREFGVIVLVLPLQTEIWPLTAALAPHLTFLTSQLYNLMYLMSRLCTYPIPLFHQLWMLVLNAGFLLAYVPHRCHADMMSSPELQEYSQFWASKLDNLGKGWIFSASTKSYSKIQWEVGDDCSRVHMNLMVSLYKHFTTYVSSHKF